MNLIRTFMIAPVMIGTMACQESQQVSGSTVTSEIPAKAYALYLQSAARGHTYEEALSFHSQQRQSEMVSWLEEKSRKSNKTIEQYQDFFLSLTRQEAKCLSLVKLSEKSESGTAVLTYKGTDTCTTDSKAAIQVTVNMVLEKSWKIQSENVSISAKGN